jgi:hypothetical protein
MTDAQYLYIFGDEIREEYLAADIQAESKPFTRNVPAKHSVKIIGGVGFLFQAALNT